MPTIEEITRGVRNAPRPGITDIFRPGGGATGQLPVGQTLRKAATTTGGLVSKLAGAGGKVARFAGRALSTPLAIGAIGAEQALTSATDTPEDIERKLSPGVFDLLGGNSGGGPSAGGVATDLGRRLLSAMIDIGNTGGIADKAGDLIFNRGGEDQPILNEASQKRLISGTEQAPGVVSNLPPTPSLPPEVGTAQQPVRQELDTRQALASGVGEPAPSAPGQVRTNALPEQVPGIANKPALEKRKQIAGSDDQVQIIRGLQQSVVSPGADEDFFTSPERVTSAAPRLSVQDLAGITQRAEQEQLAHAVSLATRGAPPRLRPALARKAIAGFKGSGVGGIVSQFGRGQAASEQADIQAQSLLQETKDITARDLERVGLETASAERIAKARKSNKEQIFNVKLPAEFASDQTEATFMMKPDGTMVNLSEQSGGNAAALRTRFPNPGAIRKALEDGVIDQAFALSTLDQLFPGSK